MAWRGLPDLACGPGERLPPSQTAARPAAPRPGRTAVRSGAHHRDPCGPGGQPVPWRGPSKGLGPSAHEGHPHLAAPGAAADARARSAGAIPDRFTTRTTQPRRHDHSGDHRHAVGHRHDHRLDRRRAGRRVRGGGSSQCRVRRPSCRRQGTRFEALEPLRQGVREHFGGFSKGIASGLAVRHDHGSQYMSRASRRSCGSLGSRVRLLSCGRRKGMAVRSGSSAR